MNKNYKDEFMPESSDLLKKADEILTGLSNIKTYTFWDIFKLSKKEEYCYTKIFDGTALLNCKNNSNKENEISGLYVFIKDSKPIYIGISKTIIRRIRQHMYGENHNESTLAFLIALKQYEEKEGREYDGERSDFPYNQYRPRIQDDMRDNWKIKIIKEKCPYTMHFLEVHFSIKLQTYWNSFETH
jgi:hypothetical protein